MNEDSTDSRVDIYEVGRATDAVLDEYAGGVDGMLRACADGLFPVGGSSAWQVKGALVKAIPKRSHDYGNLMGTQSWAAVEEVAFNDAGDVVAFTHALR